LLGRPDIHILYGWAQCFQHQYCSFSFLPYKNVHQFTITDNKHQLSFRGHFRILGPHCGTCFLSPFWRLEFGGAFCLLWKVFVPPYRRTKKIKVKQSHYRLGHVLRVPGGCGSQISRQSAHEGGKVVTCTHRPPLPPGNIPGTRLC
jgi:hypothetical protein